MFSRTGMVVRPIRTVFAKCVQRRNFWDFPQVSNLRAVVRDMDRSMERLHREFFNHTPLLTQISPRLVPIHGGESEFHLNIDVQGYKPEEVSVNISGNVLTIKGKMERTGEDGTKHHQEFTRQMTLPDNIKPESLKSYLNSSGLLTIEAPVDAKVSEIPVKHLNEPSTEESKK